MSKLRVKEETRSGKIQIKKRSPLRARSGKVGQGGVFCCGWNRRPPESSNHPVGYFRDISKKTIYLTKPPNHFNKFDKEIDGDDDSDDWTGKSDPIKPSPKFHPLFMTFQTIKKIGDAYR